VLFAPQTAEALAEAVRRCADLTFDPLAIRAHAERFSAATFRRALGAFVEQAWAEHRQRGAAPLPPLPASAAEPAAR